jgi:hypothetical protein
LPSGEETTASIFAIWSHSQYRRRIVEDTALYDSCLQLDRSRMLRKMAEKEFHFAERALNIADGNDCSRELENYERAQDRLAKAIAEYEQRRSAKYFSDF